MSKRSEIELSALMNDLVASFRAAVEKDSTTPGIKDYKLDLDLRTWLRYEGGVQMCRGDYTTFLIGVVAILDDLVHRHPEHRPAVMWSKGKLALYLTPEFFADCVRNVGVEYEDEF